jgi:hypothetical protein
MIPPLCTEPIVGKYDKKAPGPMPPRRFPLPWSVDRWPSTRRLAYCRGGIGVRDDGGAVGARDDGGDAGGLRAGAAGACGGGSGIFKSISATAASNRAISRLIWS